MQVTARLPSTLSAAEDENVKTAPAALVASMVALAGTVTTPGLLSATVTVNEAVPALPCASVAEHVTVVAPAANVAPLAGVQLAARLPSTLSIAAAVKVNTPPLPAVAQSSRWPAGDDWRDVSRTVTVNELACCCASRARCR